MSTAPFYPCRLSSALRLTLLAASATLAAALTGCAGFTTVEPTQVAPAAGATMLGSVHGGQQPISGAHVHLYTVGTTGYGSASNNIITSGFAGSDAYGNYVLTNASGNFSLPTASYTCTSNSLHTYLLATGGNPGLAAGTSNSAITLLAITGKCGNISGLTNAAINEVSTVSTVTTLQQFMTGVVNIGTPGAAKSNLVTDANLALDLVPIATGVASTTNAAGTGITPRAEINTLGNVLAPCINSASPTSTDCANLFAAVTPSGGTQPTDVASAMLMIAQNPGVNVPAIYQLASATSPFQPTLAAAPSDFALAITYSGNGLSSPQNIVIDSFGDAFIGNCPSCAGVAGTDSIIGITPSGGKMTGSPYTTNIHKPTGLAFDNAGNLWSTNLAISGTPAQIVKQSGTTGAVAFAFNDSTITSPQGITIDSSNNAWIADQNTSSVVEVLSGGTRTLAPITQSGFLYPQGIAIDGSGNIFAAGVLSSSIIEINAPGGTYGVAKTITGSGLDQPVGLSIDHAGNLFTVDNNSSEESVINGASGIGTHAATGVGNANYVAIDGAGTGWIANCYGTNNCSAPPDGALIHITNAPLPVTADSYSNGLRDPNLNNPVDAAVDSAGNVWMTNVGSGTVTEYLGVAVPVVTPIAAGTKANTLGTRP